MMYVVGPSQMHIETTPYNSLELKMRLIYSSKETAQYM